MSEKSILDMTNEEILSLIQRNKTLREEATQEKLVTREREKREQETKVKAKGHKDAAMDILKDYMAGVVPPAPLTPKRAKEMAGDILKEYMKEQEKGKNK